MKYVYSVKFLLLCVVSVITLKSCLYAQDLSGFSSFAVPVQTESSSSDQSVEIVTKEVIETPVIVAPVEKQMVCENGSCQLVQERKLLQDFRPVETIVSSVGCGVQQSFNVSKSVVRRSHSTLRKIRTRVFGGGFCRR